MKNLTAKAAIQINAPATKVWEALTTPEIIKAYFFGTNAESDWKVGSPLLFKGEWEGKSYVDKGTILKSEPPHVFEYDYISSVSGMEDKPENYATITYKLEEKDGGTFLSISQTNCANEEACSHSEKNWLMIMEKMREIVEKK